MGYGMVCCIFHLPSSILLHFIPSRSVSASIEINLVAAVFLAKLVSEKGNEQFEKKAEKLKS